MTSPSDIPDKPLVFAGTPAFAAEHLQALIDARCHLVAVVTQPDRPARRGRKPQMSPVKQLALKHHIPVLQPEKLRAEHLAAYHPWVMVVVAYGQILLKEVIQLPDAGCINVHASLLPRWRGAAPIQRAIQAGDQETGITLIQIDEGLDTGVMLMRERLTIEPDDNAASLQGKLSRLGQSMLVRALGDFDHCLAQSEKQDDSEATYAKKLDKDEARVDWSLGAMDIERNIRAFNPEPMAYCFLGDMRVRLIHAVSQTNDTDASHSSRPGQIIELTKKGLKVACGQGCLTVTRLQLPLGKGRPLSASDLLNARADMFSSGTLLT